jgi:multimeric flavodoxin WrbA
LLGSPRREGNSATIAKRFIETATSLGAEVKTYELNRMNYRGCQGCATCKTKLDRCVLKDDLTGVLEAIKETDVILLSAPIYFQEVPGQVKCFIDRTYSFLAADYRRTGAPSRVPAGKKVILITTQGAPEAALAEIPDRYSTILKHVLAASEVHIIRGCGVGSGGVVINVPDKYLQQAEEIAHTVMA